jgi:hypothetical protein
MYRIFEADPAVPITRSPQPVEHLEFHSVTTADLLYYIALQPPKQPGEYRSYHGNQSSDLLGDWVHLLLCADLHARGA